MRLKKCKKCQEIKDRAEFNKLTGTQYKESWDCRDSYCTPCRVKYQTERRQNIKQTAVKYKGGICEDCGIKSSNYVIYDFHHLSTGEKDFTIGGHHSKSFESIKKELDKCVLLCSNCHRIRHSIIDKNSLTKSRPRDLNPQTF